MTEYNKNNADRPQKAGTVIHIDGQAHVMRLDEGQVRLSLGVAIKSGDVVETAANGKLTILFSDGSELMLGPDARFSLDSFAFNRALRYSRLDAWVLEGSFVFACGMTSDGGAAVFQTRQAKIHVTNGKIAGKTNPVEQVSMFSLLPQSDGYVGSASLIYGDGAVLLGGANDTIIVMAETGKASSVVKLSEEDLAESYAGLFVGAWHDGALETMSPANLEKNETRKSSGKMFTDTDSKKTA